MDVEDPPRCLSVVVSTWPTSADEDEEEDEDEDEDEDEAEEEAFLFFPK